MLNYMFLLCLQYCVEEDVLVAFVLEIYCHLAL